MLVARGSRMVEVPSSELTLFTFGANFNPIYNTSESELTVVKIAGVDLNHAYSRLEFLVGGMTRAKQFTLIDQEPYVIRR